MVFMIVVYRSMWIFKFKYRVIKIIRVGIIKLYYLNE